MVSEYSVGEWQNEQRTQLQQPQRRRCSDICALVQRASTIGRAARKNAVRAAPLTHPGM